MAEDDGGGKRKLSSKQKKQIAIGGGIAGLLGLGYFIVKGRSSSSSAQSASQYLTPDSLVTSGTGGVVTLGGVSGSPVETITPPGAAPSPGGTGAAGIASSGVPTPQVTGASLLGFTNPNTPVSLVGGNLIDTGTGRIAYYGPNGQPGSASDFSGAASWTDPTGKTVYYNPTGYGYSDTTRHPDLPPMAGLASASAT